jgi:hypothetical protein
MAGVLRRYVIWVRSHTNGVFQTKEHLAAMRERVDDHLEAIRAVKDPFFWGF